MHNRHLPPPPGPSFLYAVMVCLAHVVAPAHVAAQADPDAVIARADSIRGAMADTRPPNRHETDVVDVATFPLKVMAAPFNFVLVTVPSYAVGRFTLPTPPGFFVRTLDGLQNAGIHPGVHTSIGPRSGPAVSMRVDRFRPLELETSWSWKRSYRHLVGSRFSFAPVTLAARAQWKRDGQVAFYGIGPDTPDDLALYRRERFDGGLFTAVDLHPIVLRGDLAYEEDSVGNPIGVGDERQLVEAYDETDLVGATDRLRYVRTSFGVDVDLTRRVGFQDRGLRFSGYGSLYSGVKGTESDFHKLRVAAHALIPLNPRQLLALAVRTEANRGRSGEIPFYHLAQLGGEPTALGYPDTRFTERDMVSLSAEWQYEIWRDIHNGVRIESFLHFGEGAVGYRFGDIGANDWHASYAFGLRAAGPSRLLGLVYVAFSEETVRFNVAGEVSP